MITLQQAFETALDIVENRKPWRCVYRPNRDSLFFGKNPSPSWFNNGKKMGCFLGQTMLNHGYSANQSPTYVFQDWDAATEDWEELMRIHDDSRDRRTAKRHLLKFAEKHGLHIPAELPNARQPASSTEVLPATESVSLSTMHINEEAETR